VSTVKYKVDGTLERYKTRVSIFKLFHLLQNEYYQNLLSLATNYRWSLQQYDVTNSFHDNLEEEIYMEVC